jgi:hypothetical protein
MMWNNIVYHKFIFNSGSDFGWKGWAFTHILIVNQWKFISGTFESMVSGESLMWFCIISINRGKENLNRITKKICWSWTTHYHERNISQ